MSKVPKLVIVVVSFNTKQFLDECLASLAVAIKGISAEVVVVDNSSGDGSVEMVKRRYPWAGLLALSKNVGYGAANNRAVRETDSEYVLFLNPDTIVRPDTPEKMLAFMDSHPEAGVATCRVDLADGSLDAACHRGFPTPWASFCYLSGLERLFSDVPLFGQYHMTYLPLNKVHEIDSPSGAFYLVRRAVLPQVGLFDERFFLYAEELDLSMRIKDAGWKIFYAPVTSIVHYKGMAGRKSMDPDVRRQATRAFYETMLQFYEKHYRSKYPVAVSLLVWLWIKIGLLFT